MFSAIQPTSGLHLGNYVGALKNWVAEQKRYSCTFGIVDLHAITVPQDPKELKANVYKALAYYIAAGLDTEHCTLFLQSQVPQHTELTWVLNCFTYFGELGRMTQFKDKSKRQESVSVGLYDYPVLMAADILLHDTNLVPVGDDQKQHVELTRDLAERVNRRFGNDVFVIPQPAIKTTGARIMDLQDPAIKMSKSATNPSGVLFFDDSDKQLTKKINSAVTDSQTSVNPDNISPGIRNLAEIYASLSDISPQAVLEHFTGKMYGVVKKEVGELVTAILRPLRNEANRLLSDQSSLDLVLKNGADKAQQVAEATMKRVRESVGFLPRSK
ncbi:MAG: tryptophan--tRNA ligase [Deltaproteobacteria bacterium]|nr:tryptophan--tRNA ligase [Deltaproteobacteria bacterium]